MNGSLILYINDFVFGFVEAVLGLRIVLKLLGANSAAPFVNWIYETTRPLIAPFSGMFASPILRGSFVVETSTLFALLAYMVAGYLINELILISSHLRSKYYHPDEEGEESYETNKAHALHFSANKKG